jgi:hypothetical protein
MTRSAFGYAVAVLASLTLAACDDDEAGPEEGHTPDDAVLFVGGVDVSDGLVLQAGEPVRVEVRFLDHNGEVITGIEDEHHAGLTSTPPALATVASVDGQNFQKDVTGQATPASGTVLVGYGHDEEADELSFGPFPVSVAATAAAR